MTYADIYTMLNSIKKDPNSTDTIPAVLTAWPIGEVPDFPYIVFDYPENDDIIADNYNYQKRVQLNIELYTENKNVTAETQVENTLDAKRLTYQKTTNWLDTEHMYQTLYITEVFI